MSTHALPPSRTSALPPELEHAMYGFMASHVLFAAEGAGLLDRLARGGVHKAESLAHEFGLHAPTVERVMTAAVCLGLVERDPEGYAMPARLRPFLDRTHPSYAGGVFPFFERVSTRTFAHLRDALGDGEPKLGLALGADVASTFEFIYEDAAARDRFASAMWSLGYRCARELVEHLGLEASAHLVDVGGGSGSFAVAALERWPGLTATVFELPPMKPVVESVMDRHQLRGRLDFVAGDFFIQAIPEADMCSLGFILSDWPDERCMMLLRSVYRALRPGGRVLILERLFDDDRNGPVATALMDLCMMLEPGGAHRTAAEYGTLLERTGFQLGSVHRSSGEKHMVVGLKHS